MKTRALVLAIPAVIACTAATVYLCSSDPETTRAIAADSQAHFPPTHASADTVDQPPLASAGPWSSARRSSSFAQQETEDRRLEPEQSRVASPAAFPAASARKVDPAPAAGRAAFSPPPAAQAQPHLDLMVPFGWRLPAALTDEGAEAFTPAQTRALEAIAENFLSEIPPLPAPTPRQNGPTVPGPDEAIRWDQLRAAADEQYRLLFGIDAFNQRSVAAARDALWDR